MAQEGKTEPSMVEKAGKGGNINRRTCHRTVPLEVLVLGLPRTGTFSIRQALFELGYHDVYHFTSTFENPPDCDMWVEAIRAKWEGVGKPFTRHDWDQLLGHCQAVSDCPCVFFAEELIAAYPEAKVVLLVRDSPTAWYDSYRKTLFPHLQFRYMKVGLGTTIYRWFIPWTSWDDVLNMQANYTPNSTFLEDGKKWYEDHNTMIRRLVPKERLLEFNNKEGWGPLCEFLGKEVPEKAYPRVNDREVTLKNVKFLEGIDHQKAVAKMARYAGATAVVGLGVFLAWTTGYFTGRR